MSAYTAEVERGRLVAVGEQRQNGEAVVSSDCRGPGTGGGSLNYICSIPRDSTCDHVRSSGGAGERCSSPSQGGRAYPLPWPACWVLLACWVQLAWVFR